MITAIFDLDGTLADTLEDLADSVNEGLEELGLPVHPYSSYNMFVGNGAAKLCYRALPEDKKELAGKLHELFSRNYSRNYLNKTKLYPGIHDMLRKLSENGVMLAVATNKPHDFAVSLVKELLPDISFFSILGGCDERPKKPDKAIITETLNALPCRPEKVFMTGDSGVDIQTAKNAGIIPIGCEWGFRSRAELEENGADIIVSSPAELPGIILT